MIMEQCITMKMPINPSSASTKSNTDYSTIGLALNGVSFFNENAGPGDEITEELFTFDQYVLVTQKELEYITTTLILCA